MPSIGKICIFAVPMESPTSNQGAEALPYRVLLYYNFVPVPDPQHARDEMEALCQELGLLGRILIAKEGLNGTVSGPESATTAYM